MELTKATRAELQQLRDAILFAREHDEAQVEKLDPDNHLTTWLTRVDEAMRTCPPCEHPTPWNEDESEDKDYRHLQLSCRVCGEIMMTHHFKKNDVMDRMFKHTLSGPVAELLGVVIPQDDGTLLLLRTDGTKDTFKQKP